MAYTQTTLDSLAIQIGVLLDDQTEVYWTRTEKYYAIWEAMRVWGAYTSYWRTRSSFNLAPSTPYYDLALTVPVSTLRTRTWTIGQMCTEIQYMLNEAASGVAGTGMSGQISVTSILQAIFRARNRFVLDSKIPLTIVPGTPIGAPPGGLTAIPQNAMYVHRAAWLDSISQTWTNLWRQDAWILDHSNLQWTTQPGQPRVYSEAELAPLMLQLSPAPINSGTLELLLIESQAYSVTDVGLASETFFLPDEWVHGVKYGALADLFGPDSQLKDPLREQYCDLRYKQAVTGAREIRSILRLLMNNSPVPIDSFAALDAANPYWRNQVQQPRMFGVMSDILICNPPDQIYGMTADVVQTAPLPVAGTTGYIQMGYEELDNLTNYCTHILAMKCGGDTFKSTFSHYDGFMSAVSMRGAINKAKIQYLRPLFQQPQKEMEMRPESMMETQNA